MPNRGEFRATTDQMLEIISELRDLELQKRTAPLGTPQFVDLAIRAADHARLAFRWAQLQLQMAHEAAARVDSGESAPDVHLIEVTPQPLDKILANWREAQLRLEIARPGSAEAMAAADAIERLREEYQATFEAHAATRADLAREPSVEVRPPRRD